MSNKTKRVLTEIEAERERQDAEWGQEHDDAQRAPHWESLIREYGEMAFESRMKTGNHDMAEWRRRMLQVAALAEAAVEWIDRRDGETVQP